MADLIIPITITDADQKRFWSLAKPVESGCWLWQGGSRHTFGYGMWACKGLSLGAHRWAMIMSSGSAIADGLCVCHKCDVPACVNPDHLFLGTSAENADDMKKKGRVRLPKKPGAKLTAAQVAEILNRAAVGEWYNKIADSYGVSHATIWMIVRGKTWTDVHARQKAWRRARKISLWK